MTFSEEYTVLVLRQRKSYMEKNKSWIFKQT